MEEFSFELVNFRILSQFAIADGLLKRKSKKSDNCDYDESTILSWFKENASETNTHIKCYKTPSNWHQFCRFDSLPPIDCKVNLIDLFHHCLTLQTFFPLFTLHFYENFPFFLCVRFLFRIDCNHSTKLVNQHDWIYHVLLLFLRMNLLRPRKLMKSTIWRKRYLIDNEIDLKIKVIFCSANLTPRLDNVWKNTADKIC